MNNNKKILLIGGLGFIGKNLYKKLKENNYSQVDIINRNSLLTNDPFYKIFNNNLFVGSIANSKLLKEIVPKYDIIFSLAGISGASDSILHPFDDIDINLKGHLNILEACKKSNKNKIKIIFPSSRLVYGIPKYLPVDEQHPINPNSIYAIHKYATEHYYILFSKFYNIESKILRISNPFGPYQSRNEHSYGILNNFILKALKGEKITIYGDGTQKRDFIFINDLTELMMKMIENKNEEKIFNVGSSNYTDFITAVKIIKKYVPKINFEHIPWPEIDEKIETGDYLSDISKIRKHLDWHPQTNFESGLKETIDFYAQNLEFYVK